MCSTSYDKIIIGAGLYGLYAANYCARKGQKILVLEYDPAPFERATFINQARVHMGYHYPRSLTTAEKSAGYFRRFCEDFPFCLYESFDQIYATSREFSWTNAEQFQHFCRAADIPCEEVAASRYFKPGMVDGAFLTKEYTYDAQVLKKYFLDALEQYCAQVSIVYGSRIRGIHAEGSLWKVGYGLVSNPESTNGVIQAEAPFILNASYASVNQVMKLVTDSTKTNARTGNSEKSFCFHPFHIKYELCEIILCNVSENLKGTGLTVMDGPFFSIMPFGQTGMHSLTSVTFTPHKTCHEDYPSFDCQEGTDCSPAQLCNCNDCAHRPDSAWMYMSHLARKYMQDRYEFHYDHSLFSMKPILVDSEVDDSRPTAIRVNCRKPMFISVLSGKINTVYDLDKYLE